jgi:hypothetical protein
MEVELKFLELKALISKDIQNKGDLHMNLIGTNSNISINLFSAVKTKQNYKFQSENPFIKFGLFQGKNFIGIGKLNISNEIKWITIKCSKNNNNNIKNKDIKIIFNKKGASLNYSVNNSSTDIFSTQNSSNGNISKNCSPYENKNNNNQFTKNDYKRRVSEILNCSNTSKTLLGHINVRSSAHILGEKNECFSSRIGSPTHIGTLEKKSINIDLKYLSTISKKWNFQKEFGNINTLNSMNNLPFIKKKLKFDENNHNEVL